MKRLGWYIFGLLLILPAIIVPAGAEDTPIVLPTVLLTEVKVKNTSSAQPDEFIEIYNNGLISVALEQYYLEYYNVADPTVSTATTHKGPFALPTMVLEPNSFVVLAVNPSKVSGSVQLSQITSLKDTEGLINLYSQNPITHVNEQIDSLAWKAGTDLPESIIVVPTDGSHSLQRYAESDDTPFTFVDEWKDEAATPASQLIIVPPPPPEPEPEVTEPEPVPEDPVPEGPAPVEPAPIVTPPEVTLLPIVINELLPNPLAPLTDSFDEFVELYNPNAEPVDLTGYKIQTGTTFAYSYTIPDLTIPAGGYITFTSEETPLALANSGGRARLLNAQGTTISEAEAYGEAPEGQAWAFASGKWQWTTTPTVTAQNVITLPLPVPAKTTTSTKTATTKKPAATTAKAKTTATKAATTKKTPAAASREVFDDPDAVTVAPLHPSVIAGVSILALLYAGYEYRFEASNRLYQFRRYREARRAARLAAQGQ